MGSQISVKSLSTTAAAAGYLWGGGIIKEEGKAGRWETASHRKKKKKICGGELLTQLPLDEEFGLAMGGACLDRAWGAHSEHEKKISVCKKPLPKFADK
jgi:hypothetical protein